MVIKWYDFWLQLNYLASNWQNILHVHVNRLKMLQQKIHGNCWPTRWLDFAMGHNRSSHAIKCLSFQHCAGYTGNTEAAMFICHWCLQALWEIFRWLNQGLIYKMLLEKDAGILHTPLVLHVLQEEKVWKRNDEVAADVLSVQITKVKF